MKGWLLDVNVLIALIDTGHDHHSFVRPWFSQHGSRAWATCPLTENGVVRILSAPKYRPQALRPRDSAIALDALKRRFATTHQFWPDSLSLNDDCFDLHRLIGPRQITDMYLLGLAAKSGGSVATLDRRMDWRMIRHQSANLVTVLRP